MSRIMPTMLFANTAGARQNFITAAARILSATLFKAAVICFFAIGFAGAARAEILKDSGEMSVEDAIAEGVVCLRSAGWTIGAEWLSSIGDDIHATDENGNTVLHHISDCGSTGALRALLKAGADVNATADDKDTPLHRAAWGQNAEAISVLAKAGADVNAIGAFQATPIYAPIVRLRGCEFDENSTIVNNAPNAVSVLINFGADVNPKAYFGRAPLDVAYIGLINKTDNHCSSLFKEVALALKSAGAVCNKTCNFAKITDDNDGRWTAEYSVDEMNGDVSWYASSPYVRVRTNQPLAPPYDETEAALVIACNPKSEWAYIHFTRQLPWNYNSYRGYIQTRIKFDDKIERTELNLSSSGRHVLHFRNYKYHIKKIRRHNTMLLELPVYGRNPVYFHFSLKGATSTTNSTRNSCRKK